MANCEMEIKPLVTTLAPRSTTAAVITRKRANSALPPPNLAAALNLGTFYVARRGRGLFFFLAVSAGRPTRHIVGAEYGPAYEHELVATFTTQPLLDLIGHLSAIKIMSSLCVCACACARVQ